jgi:hypothetical protein
MPGRHRTGTKEGSTGVLTFEQKAWGGGQNSDLPASAVAADEAPLLQDLVAYKGYIESHGGSQLFSGTAIPGSGTVHALRYHKTARKWILHRGSALWVAAATMPSWTQLNFENFSSVLTITGGGAQLSNAYLKGISAGNSDSATWHANLTDSAGVRTLDLYEDAGKTSLVARATRTGDGDANLQAMNSSGLHGLITIAYTGDITSGLTFSVPSGLGLLEWSYNYASNLRDLDEDFLIATANPARPSHFFIDLAREVVWGINPLAPNSPIVGSGSQAAATPYGYRLLYTFSRIEGASGPDYTKNRISGTLKWESPANSTYGGSSPADLAKDYGEFWVANPISSSNPLAFYPTTSGGVNDNALLQDADRGATHISIYRCLDFGSSGVDEVTGQANNREVYVWDGDYPIGTSQISLTKTDDDLRASWVAGFGLKTRFWAPLPHSAEILEVTPSFIYTAVRGANQVPYAQRLNRETLGSHHPKHQVLRLDDGVQVIAKSPSLISFVCAGKTWTSSPSVYEDVDLVASVYQLRHLSPASTTIGVVDWSSFTEVQEGLFVAHCSDHTIRQWDGFAWSSDLSDRRVRKLVRKMPIGSALGFIGDALLLWHRQDSAAAHNDKCLRLGGGGDAGEGWSTLARSSWIFPPLYAGPVRYQDSNGVERLLVLNSADGLFYWVETFDGPDSSGLSKLWLDKVAVDGSGGTEIASVLRLRERTGTKEHHTLRHQETHLSLRPVDEAVGYRGAFEVDHVGYVDGSPTPRETVENVPREGDITFGKEHKGRRLQSEFRFAAAGFRVMRVYSRDLEDERRALGAGYAETDEGGYQRELAGSLKHWAGRYKARLNRATGTLYTLSGDAPSQVTGPDGKSFTLSFGAGSYSQASTTAYTSFSFSFWAKGVTAAARVFALGGTAFSVSFDSVTQLNIGGQTIAIASITSGWHHFALVRSGSTVTVYQNGASVGTVTLAGSIGGGAFTLNPDQAAMQLDDWRLQTSEVSAGAWAFYFADVNGNSGGKVLP